jgi:hypothetical protein
MFIFETSYTLGYEKPALPPYLTQNKYVICFNKTVNGKYKSPYKDFLCAFGCIAYHKDSELYKYSSHSFEILALRTFKLSRHFMKE